MSRAQILITESDRFSGTALAQLQAIADVTLADLDRDGLLDQIADVDAIWIRLRHRIDGEVFERANRLQYIASPTTGLNHIDLQLADRRGVQVISLRGEVDFLKQIRATAEHTIGLILALLRQIPAATDHVSAGGWNRDLFRGAELHEKTIGVVGFGRLGRLVAKYLSAFDTQILVHDPHVDDSEIPPAYESVSLDRLLSSADIVTLHVNLCDQTTGFFGRQQFAGMKPGARFINTSRGELIDEAALIDHLKSGRLSGAAVDVLCGERSGGMAVHPLVRHLAENQNLIITPHIGGCTAESMEKTEIFLAEKLCAALQASSLSA